MQIFEVLETEQYPYMEAIEIIEGIVIKDIIPEKSKNKVYLLVDHVTKKIWTYNGPESSIRLQVYGVLLANRLRDQLKLFYKVNFLNTLSPEDSQYIEILNNKISTGKAKDIRKEDFGDLQQLKIDPPYISIFTNINSKNIIEYINRLPKPSKFIRSLLIIGGTIYTEEEVIEEFVKEEKIIKKPVKLGRLNNGFTLFYDQAYSTRLIIRDGKIEGIELFISKDIEIQPLKLEIPIITEEKFTKVGSLEFLNEAFKIPPQEFTVDEEERMQLYEKIKSVKKENE